MAWTTPRTWVGGELVTAAIFNTHIRDNIGYLYDGGDSWHNVSGGVGFQNSWVDYDVPGWGNTRYRRVGDFTVIQGLIKNGTIGATVFTLPAGYRPGKYLIWPTKDNQGGDGTYAELRVYSSGAVVANAGANAYFSVNTTFMAEQ